MTTSRMKETNNRIPRRRRNPHHEARLEHINITVTDPQRTAARLCEIFDWTIRWSGPSQHGGYTVHLGTEIDYLALYSERNSANGSQTRMAKALNHIGIVVKDLDRIENRIKALGYSPHSHSDYEPGRRFYFHDEDHIEYEVVSYTTHKDTFRDHFRRQLGKIARYGALLR